MVDSEQRCSIVIRCFNEEQHIGRLLAGIAEQTVRDPQIIVVDSGSTDATLSIASRFPVEIIPIRREEFSFGRSLNMGCAAATEPVIVLASAHVYPVYTDWLHWLCKPFEDPRVALVYGKQRGNQVTKYSEHRVFRQWFGERSNSDQTHPFCNNANAAIRRSVWQALPYDESLTGLEDLDWARRILELKHRLVYRAEAEVIHVHNESPTHIFNRYRREAIALKQIFPREQFSLWDFARLFSGNVVSDWFHAARDGELDQNLLEILVFRLMQFWGTYRGYHQHGPVSPKLRQTFYYPSWRGRRARLNSPRQIAIDYSALSDKSRDL